MITSVSVQSSRRLERRETKLITFPDGVPRLITMKRRQWEAMDWIAQNNASGLHQETLDIAYQVAIEFHDPRKERFEDGLRRSLERAISGCMSAIKEHWDQTEQDNHPDQTS